MKTKSTLIGKEELQNDQREKKWNRKRKAGRLDWKVWVAEWSTEG